LTKALWRFLADTAGHALVVMADDDPEFEKTADFVEIGGAAEDGGIPFEQYLQAFAG
jgi:hypothetical protein